ncbi:MAG TPA: orotate phosphoribosyltransferase [Candidatus Acidoferrales bacterium]|jgi:orotate phosphoribosyltransferase|nr:orotate phosphoribosyltransferase [Candidatus Acidoferrales bacterium]
MTQEQIMELLGSVGAIRDGHFELSSGLHSNTYIQCALALQFPRFAEQLGAALAAEFTGLRIECVASPALGGLILGHEVARALGAQRTDSGVPAIFVERDGSGRMTLRRGFGLEPGQPVLVVEDVWTTGGSTFETVRVIEEAGGIVVAAGAIIDRSQGRLELPVQTESLLQLDIHSYEPEDCPLCRAGSAAVKPGSRYVRVAM